MNPKVVERMDMSNGGYEPHEGDKKGFIEAYVQTLVKRVIKH